MKPSSFQWIPAGPRREPAEHRVAVGRGQRIEREPIEVAPLQAPDRAAKRVGEQLRAEAHAEHRHAALGRLVQQRRLSRQRRIGGGLLAAERHDAVDLAERGKRVAVAQEALARRAPRPSAPGRRGPG